RDAMRVGGAAGAASRRDAPGEGLGVAALEEPSAAGAGPEFNADARSSAYAFRAGSALPEDEVVRLQAPLRLLRHDGELFAVEVGALQAAFGPELSAKARELRVDFAQTPAARPELIQAVRDYNIVSYDGRYYGVPHR